MKLGILDQSPISDDQTPHEALRATMKLAQTAESLGYTRFWAAEHHGLPGLASSVPEVMLGYIGANTDKIRIGSGAVLLPYYKPYARDPVSGTCGHRCRQGAGRPRRGV